MAISDEITRLQSAKSALKTSIEGKGVTVSSSAKLEDYPALVDSIEAGGGGGGDDWLYINILDIIEVNQGEVSITWDSTMINLEFSGYADGDDRISWTSNTRLEEIYSLDSCQLRIKNIALTEGEISTITIQTFQGTETITVGYIGIRGDDYNDTTLKLVVVGSLRD